MSTIKKRTPNENSWRLRLKFRRTFNCKQHRNQKKKKKKSISLRRLEEEVQSCIIEYSSELTGKKLEESIEKLVRFLRCLLCVVTTNSHTFQCCEASNSFALRLIVRAGNLRFANMFPTLPTTSRIIMEQEQDARRTTISRFFTWES